MHRRRLIRCSLVLSCVVCLGASCDSGSRSGQLPAAAAEGVAPSGDRIIELPGVDTSELTDAEKELWINLVNEQLSPCGEPVSVARCVADRRGCGACVTAVRYVARLVMEGHDGDTIREHYAGRFGKKPAIEPRLEGAPVRGAPMAPVTIVEFSDFQCPHCGRAHPDLSRTVAQAEGKVKLVFKHYPLSGHSRALPAALAAEAAGRQGKFWEMADLLFEHQDALEDGDLLGYAQQLGLDPDRFKADMASDEVRARVDADRAEGAKVGVTATPSLFIGGRKFKESPKNLGDYVREELEL
jgi:2-hydroxychromene-2-carboxylate isomerase